MYGCESWTRKLIAEELMFLDSGVGEDCWESRTASRSNQSILKEWVLGVDWKDWCWSWNSNILATWHEELTHLKRPWAGKDWWQEEKGMTEGEMVAWHHWFNGHEFGWTPGVGDGQGSCRAAVHGVTRSWTQLNWTESNLIFYLVFTILQVKEVKPKKYLWISQGIKLR